MSIIIIVFIKNRTQIKPTQRASQHLSCNCISRCRRDNFLLYSFSNATNKSKNIYQFKSRSSITQNNAFSCILQFAFTTSTSRNNLNGKHAIESPKSSELKRWRLGQHLFIFFSIVVFHHASAFFDEIVREERREKKTK